MHVFLQSREPDHTSTGLMNSPECSRLETFHALVTVSKGKIGIGVCAVVTTSKAFKLSHSHIKEKPVPKAYRTNMP